jgi:3,4-dihydroxy 2-butanone 4-phosphate synthase/GTP cyclohydrolase II
MPLRGSLLETGRLPLETRFGRFEAVHFLDLKRGQPVWVLQCGDPTTREPVLARVHSSCLTSEVFGACDCDCAEQLDSALEAIATRGRGLVFYLMQEGRGAGFVAKARDRMMVQASRDRIHTFEAYERMGLPHDARSYREVADAVSAIGVSAPLRLLTNNPDKVLGLERVKVAVEGTERLRHRASPWNQHYLTAKYESGHELHTPDALGSAPLPETVVWREPSILSALPNFAHVATYLLPLRGAGRAPIWYRSHVYYDLQRGIERVVLEHGEGGGVQHVQRQRLLERFPLAQRGEYLAEWHETRAKIESQGQGRVLFLSPDETTPPDAATLRLLDQEVREE